MMGIGPGQVARPISDVLFLACVLWVLFDLLQRIRQNPKDQVLLFESLAITWLTIGGVAAAILARYFHFSAVPLAVLVGGPFAVFAAAAGYFAVVNWLRRRRSAA